MVSRPNLPEQHFADGSYRFDQLRPGVYAVTETQPSGFLDGAGTLGTTGGVVGDDRFSDIVLGPGDVGEGYNFGEVPCVTLNVVTGTFSPPTLFPGPAERVSLLGGGKLDLLSSTGPGTPGDANVLSMFVEGL